MRTIAIYSYDELSDEAKETAREEVRDEMKENEWKESYIWAIDDCSLLEPPHSVLNLVVISLTICGAYKSNSRHDLSFCIYHYRRLEEKDFEFRLAYAGWLHRGLTHAGQPPFE